VLKELIGGELLVLPSEGLLRDYLLDPYRKSIGTEVSIDFLFGAIAALIGSVVKDLSSTDAKPPVSETRLRYTQSAIEGAILFSAYEIILKVVKATVPEDFNDELMFQKVLETVSKEIIISN
jgi:hypothetical protein